MRLKAKTHKHIYEEFKKIRPDVPYIMFKEVVSTFNKLAMEEVINNGNTLSLGKGLGDIFIAKIDRNYSKPTIDWGNSVKDENGKIIQFAYHNDPWYLRFYWHKKYKKYSARNVSVYRFNVTRGKLTNPTNYVVKLVNALKTNPLLHYKYVVFKKEKEIEMRDVNDNFIMSFKTIREAAEYLKKPNPSNIKRVLNNPNALAYGYKWSVKY